MRYRAGTQDSANPVLEFIDTGVAVPNQYTLTIGGVGGSKTVAGLLLESMTLQTLEGEPIVFLNAPVAVLDIGADGILLDGVFGMNFLVASAFFDGFNIGPFAIGAFDFVVYDDVNGTLGFRAETQSHISVATLPLSAGINIISTPLALQPAVSSHALGSILGANLQRVHRFDTASNTFTTTTFSNGVPNGDDFTLLPGEAYVIELAADTNLPLTGFANAVASDLAPGLNFVGFHDVISEFSAYDLLAHIGDHTIVSSVSRYSPISGRYKIATQTADGIAGQDFQIVAGEGYLLSMHQGVAGLTVPRQIAVGVEGGLARLINAPRKRWPSTSNAFETTSILR